MTKKRVFTILIALTLVVTSLFMFSACATTYSLYSYEYYGKTYEIGDEFYGVEIKKDLVELKLKGEELELRISKAFIQ